ncbi:MAG: sulfite exporter TauE/SafE family protein [Devosia sp.]
MPDPLFLAVVMLAGVVVGMSKSGIVSNLGAINVPLLSLVMSARDAAGVLLPVMLVTDAIALFIYARHFDRRILAIMLPGCLAGIGIGWALSAVVDESAVRLAVGVVTLGFVIDAVFPLRKKLSGLPPSRLWGTIWGSVSGFTSFVSHTGGPPFHIYVLPQRLDPKVFAGTVAVFFAITNAVKLVPYYFLGQLQTGNLLLSALLVPTALLSMAAGVFLVRRISGKAFYRIAYTLMAVFSLKLIWDGATGLIGLA